MLGENPVTTVLGQRGTGKTSWVKAHLKSLTRFILWDTLGEYSGAEIVNTREELYEEVTSWEGPGQVIFNCLEEDEEASLGFMCRLAEAVGDLCLIVEEVDTYATPYRIPNDLRRLLKVGRHYDISMVFVSRRPAEINRLITSQSRRFVCFRLIEPTDVRYLSSILGAQAEAVRDLPDLHFLDWQNSVAEKGVINFQ